MGFLPHFLQTDQRKIESSQSVGVGIWPGSGLQIPKERLQVASLSFPQLLRENEGHQSPSTKCPGYDLAFKETVEGTLTSFQSNGSLVNGFSAHHCHCGTAYKLIRWQKEGEGSKQPCQHQVPASLHCWLTVRTEGFPSDINTQEAPSQSLSQDAPQNTLQVTDALVTWQPWPGTGVL